MPRKTKKKKKLAQLHRSSVKSMTPLQKTGEFEDKTVSSPPNKQGLYSYQSDILMLNQKPKKETSKTDYSYVLHDLKKISIFTILALFFQVVLYFILNRG